MADRADGRAPGAAGVTVRLRHPNETEEEIACDYLCACDGAPSFVRHALALPFPGAPYEAQFFLADVMLDRDRSPDHWYADI
jgi:2-polyprenyl-6-methoxyphenol hydroxylase-like FAD-dependent oxidoreductase